MKLAVLSTAVFSLILGIALPAYGQQDDKNEKQNRHRQEQEARKQPSHDQQRAQEPQNQDRRSRQVQDGRNQGRQQQQTRQQPERDQGRRQEQQIQPRQNQDRQQQAQQQERRSGFRSPQDRYRGYFGPQHWFRISGRPFMVSGGYPRFQYEGYWITLLDPWPEYWSNDWYDNDDVYVDYRNDGYYMFNRRYPDAAIAISISM